MLFKLTIISAFGSALGAEVRYFISRYPRFEKLFAFSLATIMINISGSFILGIILDIPLSIEWKSFLGSGIIGGLTTFSTFILETVSLSAKTNKRRSIAYLFISIVLSLIAFEFGWQLG
ncbi:CrcB family protein [Oenococcus sicerae]|uniref:Fluoride-specific ion channel FluC n=1 Tax=Oenococcus sicerae TaxID=2203724 RepID=A0AAJ1RCQ9_9LACO|nr:CrcB family protein [Oenococcus sicerae]MDN6899591.1 CrcB family protein [Oenococcus sicerae]QAS70280.1 CrcB family protein [Oenococcus sicerae]VDK14224.1 hypothetical protein OAL24_01024 [Oenococcus sicerae]